MGVPEHYTEYQLAWLGHCVVQRLHGLDRASLRAVAHNLKKSDLAEEWTLGEVLENACIIMDAVDMDKRDDQFGDAVLDALDKLYRRLGSISSRQIRTLND